MAAAVVAARSLVGVRFRPQGRDPSSGLDCVGLVASAHRVPVGEIPRNYRLRGHHVPLARSILRSHFHEVSPSSAREGDVLLLQVASEQVHLAVHCGASFIHADAKLQRIVEVPGEPPWPLLGVFRRTGV